MIFGETKRDPLRSYGAAAMVALIHLILIGVLLKGLDQRAPQPVAEPLRVFIVAPPQALPRPAPPVPAKPVPAPRPAPPHAAPPVPTSPVQPPAPVAPPVTTTAPPAAAVVRQAAPAPRPALAPSPNRNVAAVCPNLDTLSRSILYPLAALRRGVNAGQVVVEFTIDPGGHPKDFVIQQTSDGAFNRAALELARKLECVGQGQDVRVQLPVGFHAGN